MLNIQEVVNFLNEALNVDEKITFNIRAEVGESDNESLINGILRTAQAKTTPIANYTENRYSFVCELGVPTGRSNKVFIKAQDIVSQFDNSYNGKKIDFSNGSATINISLGKPENFKVVYNVGECTPLYFSMDMIYTESGVMSIQKKWYLSEDGTNFYEIPYESESVVLNKEGITRKVDFDKYTKTFLTGQTKFYKFKFPYQNTDLGNMLMKDILNGDFKKQYTLKYVDGINYIDNDLIKPAFTSKVSIFMSGDVNSQVVNVGKFDITFTDVDDGNTTVKYYIGLFDWMFDMSGEDTRLFSNQANQRLVIGQKITASGQSGWQQIKAPNLDSIFVTNQVFPNETNMEIFEVARKNYAVIRVITGTLANPTTDKWIFYGIANCQIGANKQITLDLKEDTIQTFLPDTNLTIADSFVERSHLDRWTAKDTNNYYYYNFKLGSNLFEREDIQGPSKKTTKKEKLIVSCDGTQNYTGLNKWVNDNVSHWTYYYFAYQERTGSNNSDLLKYNYGAYNTTTQDLENVTDALPQIRYKKQNLATALNGCVSVLAVPCMKTDKNIINKDGVKLGYVGGYTGIQSFIETNFGFAYVKAIKNSIIPPFDVYNYVEGTDYSIDQVTGDITLLTFGTIKKGYTDGSNTGNYYWGSCAIGCGGTTTGVFCLDVQYANSTTRKLFIQNEMYTNKYTASNIKSTIPAIEPKLYNEDYATYHVYIGGQSYDMPVSKTSNKPCFAYTEPISPDITKFYLAFDSANSNMPPTFNTTDYVFGTNETKDYTGLVGTMDLSMWFSTSKLDEWLATNKNNTQIFNNQQQLAKDEQAVRSTMRSVTAGVGGFAGVLGGFVTGHYGAGLATGIGGLTSLANTIAEDQMKEWELETEKTNRSLTIDNMRQSPSSLSALNSNSVLLFLVEDISIYIELQEMIPFEKQQMIDRLKKYGYSVNAILNIRNNIISRIEYNYIKAQISALYGIPMSTQEKMDFKQRFSAGIRFWHNERINYTNYVNYERYLAGA